MDQLGGEVKPHVWMNKDNAQLIIAFPWIAASEDLEWDLFEEVQIALTAIHQVGWMLCNENDVYFGLPMNIAEQFEDLGVL